MKKSKNYIYYLATAFLFSFLLISEVIAEEVNCPLGPNVTRDLYGILKIMKIAAPLLCIGFSAWEAVRAVAKGEADAEIKKVVTKFGQRMIYAVILFFIPVLVEAILNIAGISSGCDLQNPIDNGAEVDNKKKQDKSCAADEVWNGSMKKCVKINTSTTVVANGKADCENKNGTWHDATGTCIESCSGYINSSECSHQSAVNKGCQWVSGKCTHVGN